jgi:hypothetical protein
VTVVISGLVLASQVAVAAALALAAGAKLLSRAGTIHWLAQLGFRGLAGSLAGLFLPLIELGVAGLIAFPATARFGAGIALCLFTVFTAVILVVESRTIGGSCNCFGRLSTATSTAGAVFRNVALMLMALTVVLFGNQSTIIDGGYGTSPTQFSTVTSAAAVVVTILLLIAPHSARRLPNVTLTPANRASEYMMAHRWLVWLRVVGTALGSFDVHGDQKPVLGVDSNGRRYALDDLLQPQRHLLIAFADTDAAYITHVVSELTELERESRPWLDVVILSPSWKAINSGMSVLVDETGEVARDFGAADLPAALLINFNGLMTAPHCLSRMQRIIQSKNMQPGLNLD